MGPAGFDAVMLSRLQFAFTALFHILWPVLIVGLSVFLLVLEILWLKTRNEAWYRHFHFWTKILLLNIAVGVVTGFPMEFQFGTNWSRFARAGGDIFGHLLGFEATIAFMLEASFLSIMVFGWKRVRPGMHLFATGMVALGATLSVFWIMDANSWMQTPAGGYFIDGKVHPTSNLEAILNPNFTWAFLHKETACLMITAFVVAGISAGYLLRNRHADFFLASFKLGVAGALVCAPLQVYFGDGSGRVVFEHQPAKLAGMEAHWETNAAGTGAAWHVVAWPDPSESRNAFEVNIPYGLSLITTRDPHGTVEGLTEFPPDRRPPIWLPFYGFRVMIAIGFAAVGLVLWTAWAWWRGRLHAGAIGRSRRLLAAWVVFIPLPYVAMEAGWVTREVGRQPWVIQDALTTADGASPIATGLVGASLAVYVAVYTLLAGLYAVGLHQVLKKGPRLSAEEAGDHA